MTATAAKPRHQSSAAIRKELDRRSASRETLLTEIDQAREKLAIAMDTGDTAACVRLQGRLLALEGLRDQETRLMDRLTEELAETEARDTRRKTLAKLVSLAQEAEQALRAVERESAALNTLLQQRVPPILDHQLSIGAKKLEFLALARNELGANLSSFSQEDNPSVNAVLGELEELGADLSVILACWGGTPPTHGERYYEAPVITPFGRNIGDLLDTLGYIRITAAYRREP